MNESHGQRIERCRLAESAIHEVVWCNLPKASKVMSKREIYRLLGMAYAGGADEWLLRVLNDLVAASGLPEGEPEGGEER